jgi:Fe-Mn family superoxide dismutase
LTSYDKEKLEGLSSQIRKDLGLKTEDTLQESYVAQAKTYSLSTDLLSAKTKKGHEEKYEGYVKTLNRVSAELDTADRQDAKSTHSEYRSLKIDEVWNLNAVYLHELYFANISDPHSQIDMDTLAYMRLERDFGTFDDWQFDLIACAMASRDGWAVTAYNTYLQRYMNFFIDSHDSHVPLGCYPVVVIDVWEHAYYRDYLTDRRSYVYAMMKELRWDVIEERFKRAEKIAKAMR